MKRTHAPILVAALAALGIALGIGRPSPAAVPGHGGVAKDPASAACFIPLGATDPEVLNNCGTTLSWCVYPFIQQIGNHTVSAYGYGSLSCSASALNANGTVAGGTASVVITSQDTHTNTTIGNVNVTSFGTLFVCCDLAPTARLATVNF